MINRFLLTKDSPELRAGAILEYDKRHDDYMSTNHEYYGLSPTVRLDGVRHERDVVEKQREWFEPIFLVPVPTRFAANVAAIFASLGWKFGVISPEETTWPPAPTAR